jgi:hypothetical protein
MKAPPSSRIIGSRTSVEDSLWYEQFYEPARDIDIVGIAGTSFAKYVYPFCWPPNYVDPEPVPSRVANLGKVLLFKNLSERRLSVRVRIVDPFCDFVEKRSMEESNPELKRDILKVIDAFRRLCHDLGSAWPSNDWRRIRGRMSIALIRRNPYVSIFGVTQDGQSKGHDLMYVGWLLQGFKGKRAPMLLVENRNEERHIYSAVSEHLSRLDEGAHKLFEWSEDRVEFKERVDIPKFTHSFATTGRTRQSHEIQMILQAAIPNEKPVIPVLLDGAELPPESILGRYEAINYDENEQSTFEKLARVIGEDWR